MELLSRKNAGRRLVVSWLNQYGKDHPHCKRTLLDLSPTATDERINAAFASLPFGSMNRVGHTLEICHECGNAETVVRLGEEPAYESSTANVCLDCLKKAVALVEGEV